MHSWHSVRTGFDYEDIPKAGSVVPKGAVTLIKFKWNDNRAHLSSPYFINILKISLAKESMSFSENWPLFGGEYFPLGASKRLQERGTWKGKEAGVSSALPATSDQPDLGLITCTSNYWV